jgi:phosphopantetheine--protein transferase-like protein
MCKILGVGIDLCSVTRMQELLSSGRSLHRLFTPEEERYIRSRGAVAAQSMAGIFAAKEAVCKALGTGIAFPLTDIEIGHTAAGQPTVRFDGHPGRFHLSITHEGDMAAAMVIHTDK